MYVAGTEGCAHAHVPGAVNEHFLSSTRVYNNVQQQTSNNFIIKRYMFRSLSTIIHSVFCLTTGPKPLPKRFLHIVRSRAFK
jgi:hypothetical protein